MNPKRDGITAKELKRILSYNPVSGVFTWKIALGKKSAGSKAGCPTTAGYNRIVIHGREYRCARLAWLYMTGDWPAYEVDHEDRNKSNDKWANLRAANRVQNGANRTRHDSNPSGYKGVIWIARLNTWAARITFKGKAIHLGCRKDPKIAALLYDNAAKRLFGEFCSLNFNI